MINSYHPDPEIDRGIQAEMREGEIADVCAGYPPSKWTCPECGASHSRGHFMALGTHRCLGCGYVGGGGYLDNGTAGTGP